MPVRELSVHLSAIHAPSTSLGYGCEKTEHQDIHIDEANGGARDACTPMIELHERCKITNI